MDRSPERRVRMTCTYPDGPSQGNENPPPGLNALSPGRYAVPAVSPRRRAGTGLSASGSATTTTPLP